MIDRKFSRYFYIGIQDKLIPSVLAQDLNEQTSLYLSVLGGHVDVVEYLLSFRVHALTSQEIESFKRRSTINSESNQTLNSHSNHFHLINRYYHNFI
jgi:hypothetical protein